jgi:hypothetical protein
MPAITSRRPNEQQMNFFESALVRRLILLVAILSVAALPLRLPFQAGNLLAFAPAHSGHLLEHCST